MDETTPQATTNGYSKRPLWQWIALYVLIGVIVYGLLYYFVFAKKSGYQMGQSPSPTAAQQEAVSPTVMQASPSSTITQQQNTVTLTASGFTPSVLTIKVGQTVTWTNSSGKTAVVASDPHPTHTAYPPLNLGSFADGASLSLSFPKAGTYGYHNHLNPGETGTIVVQ